MAGHASSGATATKFSDSDDRVGIVSWDYGEHARGGLGRAMAEIATCFCGTGLHSLARQIRTVSVCAPCIPVPQRTNHIALRVSKLIQRIADSRFLFIMWLCCGLQQWIDTHRIRTVILPTGPGGLFLWRKPKRCRLIVVCYHTYRQQARLVSGQWWKMLFIPFERRTLALADRVLCYCADTERILLQKYGVHRTKLKLLPQILDIAAWYSNLQPHTYLSATSSPRCRALGVETGPSGNLKPRESCLCVFVGRLDRRKGIDVLLRAWERLAHRPRLVIVGDGQYRREVRSFAARCASVQWIPSLSREELVELVQSAAIALCPSYLEGFGLACAEAMAAGTCVIASDCDGLRSLITHGETGWLVRPGNPEAFANGLAALLRDAALRRRLAEAAQDAIRRRFVLADAARLLVLECS